MDFSTKYDNFYFRKTSPNVESTGNRYRPKIGALRGILQLHVGFRARIGTIRPRAISTGISKAMFHAIAFRQFLRNSQSNLVH
jgi:hypothetical protein